MAGESSVLVRLRLLGGSSFAREAKQAGRGLHSIGDSGGRVSTRLNGVNRALGVAAGAMRTFGTAAGVAAAGGLAYSVKQGATFEQTMANVQARLLTTKENMNLLSNQALDLGAKTSFSAGQAADAMSEFAAAGFDTRQIMKLMPGTLSLAAASGSDLAFSAETMGAMMRQFGLAASDGEHVADLLTVAVNKSAIGMEDLALTMKYAGPVAGRFNQSIEDIGASAAILGNVGIKGETAGTTLRRAFVNLVRPSKKTVDTLDDVGISTAEFAKATVNAKGDLRAFPSILGNLSKHLSVLSKPDQRRVLTQLFGVEALPGMLTLFGKGEAAIRKMSRELQNSGGAAQRTANIMRGTVKGAFDNFTGSIETASIRLTKRFQPALRNALNTGAKVVNQATTAISTAISPPRRAAAGGAKGERAMGAQTPQLTGPQKAGLKLRDTLKPVVEWMQTNLPKAGAAIMSVGRQVMEAFAPAMPFITNVVLPILGGIVKGVIGGVVAAFKVAIPIIRVIAEAFGFVGRILAPLKPVFGAIGMVIGFIAGGPILKLLGGLKYLGGAFRLLGVPIRFAVAAVSKIWGAFTRALTGVMRFVGTFRSLPARLARAALNIVGGIVNVISKLPGRLLGIAKSIGGKFIPGLIGAVRAKLASLTGFMGRVGRAIINGVTDAVKAAPGAILNAILSVVPGAVKGAVKKVLGVVGLATGGTVRNSGWAVVGERGPELAKLPAGTTVYDANQTAAAARARAPMQTAAPIMLTANLHLNGRQIHSEVFRVDRQLQEAT